MRHYIRFDPLLPDSKGQYPDGALAAFTLVICYGEHQANRGRFRNLAILKAHLGHRARWINFLLDRGDLTQLPDGSLYIEGWDEWQEGDWKVQERVQRIRNRRRMKEVTAKVTPRVTADVTVPPVNTPSERLAVGGKHLAVSGERSDNADPTGEFIKQRGSLRGGEASRLGNLLAVKS